MRAVIDGRQTSLDVVVESAEGARLACKRLYAQAQLIVMTGGRFRLMGLEAFDDLTIRQRRFMHGAVLAQIAHQVRTNGVRYEVKVWKEYFRERFIGAEWIEATDPTTGEISTVEQRISSEELDLRQYSDWIERVIAEAVTELGVVFQFREGEREATRDRKRTTSRYDKLPGDRVDSEPYRRYVASLPCMHCGYEGASQAAHANYGKGGASKTDDRTCFPLCTDTVGRNGCHPVFDQGALFQKEARRDIEWQWGQMTRQRIASDAKAPIAVRVIAGFALDGES